MCNKENNIVYTYNFSVVFRMYAAILFSLVVLVIGIVSLWTDLSNPTRSVISSDLPPPLASLFFIFVGILLFSGFSNAYPQIRLSERGIAIKVFLFWWIFVPWKNILDIRNSLVAGTRTQIVVARRLTPIHRMFGLMYALTFRPAFRITRNLQGYHEAMRTIREQTEIKY